MKKRMSKICKSLISPIFTYLNLKHIKLKMTTMKRFDKTLLSLLTLAFFVSQSLAASQAKRVYITLDVSGSMTGNKYVLANYTTQMITTLCEEDDDVYMIINGGDLCLSRSSYPLKPIQKPMSEVCAGW